MDEDLDERGQEYREDLVPSNENGDLLCDPIYREQFRSLCMGPNCEAEKIYELSPSKDVASLEEQIWN